MKLVKGGIGEPGFTQLGHLRCVDLELFAAAFRALCGEVGRPEVRAARAEVGVAAHATRQGEDLGSLLPVGGEVLLLDPLRDEREVLAAERLLRRRALVGQNAHRGDDEKRRDDRDRPAGDPPLPAPVVERHHDQEDQEDGRDPDRGEDHRLGPLEDPQEVEEEVEVPVRPRDELRRARVGLLRVPRAEDARVARLGART